MPPKRSTKARSKRRQPWWKIHERVSFLFEILLKPFETEICHDTRFRDVVGRFRQLDVGVIDNSTGSKYVKSFVEVQKRKAKVGLPNLGDWDYKRRTLGASEMTIISEVGFTASVIAHVKKLHPDTINLGMLYPVSTGLIEKFNSTCLGVTRIYDTWWFASNVIQYQEDGELDLVPLDISDDQETKIFGPASLMDLVRSADIQLGGIVPGEMKTLIVNCPESSLTYKGRYLKRVVIVVEKHRKIWEPRTRFFAYSSVYPTKGHRGIAIISDFKIDPGRTGKLILVVIADPDNLSGNHARVAGQFEII
jgi:hypothetical protein